MAGPSAEGQRSAGGPPGKERGAPGGKVSEALFQKGMAFAQAQISGSQPSGSGLAGVSMETDDYDMDAEEDSSQSLPSNSNEQKSSLPDSGYSSLPLSDPSMVDAPSPHHTTEHTSTQLATPPVPVTTPTSQPASVAEGGGADKDLSSSSVKIESAIPYLIPKDMTLDQLHVKVGPCSHYS